MPIFETKLKFTEYLVLLAGVLLIPVVLFIFSCFADSPKDINHLQTISILLFLFGTVFLSFFLKSFHLYNDSFVIRRSLFFWKHETIFQKNEIEKIRFFRIRAGYYLEINTSHKEKIFMIVNSPKTLKDLIAALQTAGIETDVQFEIK